MNAIGRGNRCRARVRRLLGVVIIGAGLGPPAEAAMQQAGAVSGSVVASDDDRPVSGAVVLVEGTSLTAVTNALGRFELPAAPAGSVAL